MDLQEKIKEFQDGALKNVEKKFGKGTVIFKDAVISSVPAICSTGSISLDEAIGIGGFPRGRIIEISGAESSGKTTVCLITIAEAQRQGNLCAYLDVEQTFDKAYAKKLGVDVENLILVQPDCMEDTFGILNEFLDSKVIDLIVTDSTNAMIPKKILEGEVGDANMGRGALIMSQELPKAVSKSKTSNCTVIFISQIRMKIGMVFGCVHPETEVEITI